MDNNNYQTKQINYIPRQPIEIILNSKRGTLMGTKDGHKFFELDKEIIARKDENILLHLKKAFIPFSFYCIAAGQENNMLDITETNSLGASNTYAITISDGNYNISELLSSIKTKMETASTFDYVYEILYDDNTSKVSFLIKSGTNVSNSKILWNSGTNKDISLLRVLGFSADSDSTFTNSSTAVSDYVVDLADGLDSLHIKSNLVGDNIISTAGAINGGELLIIPVDLSPNSILYFDDGANPFKHQLPASSIKRIEINFTDNKDNVVDFNNIPYTLILIAEFVFDPNSALTPQNVSNLQDTQSLNIVNTEEKNKQLYNLLMNKRQIKKNDYII